jgi:diguanylate cyclase (GGDEF)-like protein
MPQEIMRAKRHQQSLSVLMLDMDHFKLFNDNFGHDAGDYVLKSLAIMLNDCLRSEDTACRIGGEEMAVLLPNTDSLAAGVVAKRLCEEVRKMALSFRGQSLGNLTLSIGVASNADAASSEDMLKQADLALYEAKDKGRNQYRYCDANLHEKEAAYLAQISKEGGRAQDKGKYKQKNKTQPEESTEAEKIYGTDASVANIKPVEHD